MRKAKGSHPVKGFYRGAVCVLAGLLLTACGGGGSEPETGQSESSALTEVQVGVIPILDVAPLYLGIQEGYFEEVGLEVSPQTAQGGAAMLPAVINGEYDFGYGNALTQIVAEESGLGITMVVGDVQGAADEETSQQKVYVPADSPIDGPEDLEGKRVAINALGNVGELGIRSAVEAAGADASLVEFVELPFPNMPAALTQGQVDAVWVVEPFAGEVAESGGRPILALDLAIAPNLTFAGYFTSDQLATSQPELAESFATAMARSQEYANENPDEVRAVLADYLQMPPEAAEGIALPRWNPEINWESLEATAAAAQRYGFLDEAPDADELREILGATE